MQRRTVPLVVGAMLAGLLTVAVSPAARAAVPEKVELVGLTTDSPSRLVTFASAQPGSLSSPLAITGLAAGDEKLLGLDVRPETGQVYALGRTRLYTLDISTGAASAVGTGAFDPALDGTDFGFEFNPTIDRIRVVSDTGQNLRMAPATGIVTTDGRLDFEAGDKSAGGPPPKISAAAHDHSLPGVQAESPVPVGTSTLYVIDTSTNTLLTQIPNDGKLRTLGEVGNLGVDASEVNGFDVTVTAGRTKDGKDNETKNFGVAAFTVAGKTGLYSIDLETGKATDQGHIGDGNTPLAGLAVLPAVDGYWLFGADGLVYGFGEATRPGDLRDVKLNKPVVGGAATASGKGYWMVGTDGGVFNFGDAALFGSMGGKPLNKPIVGMAIYPDGNGYWLVASDGGIFSFPRPGTPDRFFGSAGSLVLNKPIVGMAPYPNGNGYWLVAEDGGVFSYYDQAKELDRFFGSTGDKTLNKPIKAMSSYADGRGYWLVATDGGVFNFFVKGGADRFFGSLPEKKLADPAPVVGMATSPTGLGYWLAGSDGSVHFFGDAKDLGNAAGKTSKPVVGIASIF